MRKITYLLFALLLCLTSCKSKKALVAVPKPKLKIITFPTDTVRATSAWLTSDHSVLKALVRDSISQPKTLPPLSVTVDRTPWIAESIVNLPNMYTGISRIRKYEFTHPDVPQSFDGFRIAFISDLHYKSLFKKEGLDHLVRLLNEQHADVLLMGGDYQEGCQYVPELFAALAQVKTPMGTYGIMGNNDYERCHANILLAMRQYGMHALEHKVDTLKRGREQILIAGVRNPFDLRTNGKSPTLDLSPNDFVLLLVHTPDYVEQVSVANTDLALAGHTHGGQVVVFGIAPIVPSRYGTRFLTGLKYNSSGIPVIITNGLGTSRKDIRIGAPAEIVTITLRRPKN